MYLQAWYVSEGTPTGAMPVELELIIGLSLWNFRKPAGGTCGSYRETLRLRRFNRTTSLGAKRKDEANLIYVGRRTGTRPLFGSDPSRLSETVYVLPVGESRLAIKAWIASLQLRVLRLGFFEDGDVGIGVFPEREKIFIGGEGPHTSGIGIRTLRGSRLQSVRPRQSQMR